MGSEDSTMQGDQEETLTIPTGWYALLQCSLLFLSFFLPLKVAPQRLCTQGWPVRCPVSSPTTLPEPLSAVATRLLETMPYKMSWVFSMTSPGMEGPGATCFPSVAGVTFASVVGISKFPDLFDILVLWEKSHLDVVFSLNMWGLFRSVLWFDGTSSWPCRHVHLHFKPKFCLSQSNVKDQSRLVGSLMVSDVHKTPARFHSLYHTLIESVRACNFFVLLHYIFKQEWFLTGGFTPIH